MFLALALLMLALAPVAAADPVEYLPTSHWAYVDLKALWSRGAIDSLDMSVLPWSRVEIARALRAGLERDSSVARDPVYSRLAWQFSRELHWLGKSDAPLETRPIVGLRADGEEVRLQVGIDTAATGSPPSKMQVTPGSGAFLLAKGYFWPSVYVGTELWAERTGTERNIGDSLIKNEDLFLTAREAYVTFAPRNLTLLFGLTETRWGPGRRGSLLLADVGQPYLTFRADATIAGKLGFAAVHGSLVQSDNRYLAAHRVSFQPTRSLSLGLSETARYDARSPELLYVLNLIPYTIVERYITQNRTKAPEISTRNNVMISLDAVWRVRSGLRLYGEFLLDELSTEHGNVPHRLGWQLGGSLHPMIGGTPVELAFEYSKVFRYAYSVFYDRNYILAEDPLGYREGPDSEHYGVGIKVDPGSSWWALIDVDLTRRGEGFLGEYWDPSVPEGAWSGLELSGVVESTVRAFASTTWVPRDNVRVELGAGLRHVQNLDNREGENDTQPEAIFGLYLRK